MQKALLLPDQSWHTAVLALSKCGMAQHDILPGVIQNKHLPLLLPVWQSCMHAIAYVQQHCCQVT